MIKLQLHENWQLCNIRQLDWIPAQIPGDIYAALLKTGKMPDPFFGDNEYQAKALMEEDYEYRTVFNYPPTGCARTSLSAQPALSCWSLHWAA